MNKLLKTGAAVIAALMLHGSTHAQPTLVAPSFTDNVWTTTPQPISGLNTAIIDIPLGTLGSPPTGFAQLAACAYLNTTGGGVTVKDMVSGSTTTLTYPLIGSGSGVSMNSVPDVVLGNVPLRTSGANIGQEFMMAVGYVSDTGEVTIDYFTIDYLTYGTGGTFNIVFRRREILSLPNPPGRCMSAAWSPAGTVHLDVVADYNVPIGLKPFGTPRCDHFFVAYDGENSNCVSYVGGPLHYESWVFTAYGGNNTSNIEVAGLSYTTTNVTQYIGNSDFGIQPDIAGVTYKSKNPLNPLGPASSRDVAWLTYTNSGVNTNVIQDGVWVEKWMPTIGWGLNPPSYYGPELSYDWTTNYGHMSFFHPRIDGIDDWTVTLTEPDSFKVVYETDTSGMPHAATASAGPLNIMTFTYNSFNIDLSSGLSPSPSSAISTYSNHLPAVAYGLYGPAAPAAGQYMMTTATSVPTYGEYMTMQPIDQGVPLTIGMAPDGSQSYFVVDSIYPLDMASCSYANAVSTPANKLDDAPLTTWAAYDAGSGNYIIYYKNAPYNPSVLGPGYVYRHSQATGVGIAPEKTTAVQVFPNPATESITIANPACVHADRYIVTNMLGQQMMQGQLAEGNNAVSITQLAPGGYVVALTDAGKQAGSLTFIKK